MLRCNLRQLIKTDVLLVGRLARAVPVINAMAVVDQEIFQIDRVSIIVPSAPREGKFRIYNWLYNSYKCTKYCFAS